MTDKDKDKVEPVKEKIHVLCAIHKHHSVRESQISAVKILIRDVDDFRSAYINALQLGVETFGGEIDSISVDMVEFRDAPQGAGGIVKPPAFMKGGMM